MDLVLPHTLTNHWWNKFLIRKNIALLFVQFHLGWQPGSLVPIHHRQAFLRECILILLIGLFRNKQSKQILLWEQTRQQSVSFHRCLNACIIRRIQNHTHNGAIEDSKPYFFEGKFLWSIGGCHNNWW